MQTMDQRISDSRKKLNRMRYDTTRYQKKLKDLQTQHDQMVKDSQNAVETDAGESQEAQVGLGILCNRRVVSSTAEMICQLLANESIFLF